MAFSFSNPTPAPASSSSSLFSFPSSSPSPSPSLSSSSAASAASRFESRLLALKAAYDPNSPDCRFHFIFYNRVSSPSPSPPRPACLSESVWAAGIKNNPDPSQFTPVLAVGMADLKKRINEQVKAASAFNSALSTISLSYDSMHHVHESLTKELSAALRRTHEQQQHRLMTLINRLEVSRAAGLPLLADEVDYRRQLELLERRLARPGEFLGRTRELAASARLISEKAEAAAASQQSSAKWLASSLSDTSGPALFEFLSGQKSALEFLTQTMQQDAQEIGKLKEFVKQKDNRDN